MKKNIYACYLNDENELERSSSGGAFTALTNTILSKGGKVIACNYDYDLHKLEFDIADSVAKRDLMRGSKYIQADPTNLYRILKSELSKNEDNPLMIVGTPCQIAGLKSWIMIKKIKYTRELVFCDLICHGVSSPVFWRDYAKLLEKKIGKKMKFLTFKNKDDGWVRPKAQAKFDDQVISIEDYAYLYRSNAFMRKSCYNCKFSSMKRETDITIGDFWGIEKINPKFTNNQGTSLVITHTEAGLKLFKESSEYLSVLKSDLESCLQPNLQHATIKPKFYDDFNDDYKRYGVDYVNKKYITFGSNSFSKKIRRTIFNIKYKGE